MKAWSERPAGLPRPVLIATALGLFIGVAALDFATGDAVSVEAFYTLPVLILGWFVGRSSALGVAVLAAGSQLAVHLVGPPPGHLSNLLVWNVLMDFGLNAFLAFAVASLRRAVDSERDLARVDPLTGAANPRAFRERLEIEMAHARREGRGLSVAYLDVDDLQGLNRTEGRTAGDIVLRVVSAAARERLRSVDMFARMGGDEFVILFPGGHDERAEGVLSTLRAQLAAELGRRSRPVTVSMGFARFDPLPDSVDGFLDRLSELIHVANPKRATPRA